MAAGLGGQAHQGGLAGDRETFGEDSGEPLVVPDRLSAGHDSIAQTYFAEITSFAGFARYFSAKIIVVIAERGDCWIGINFWSGNRHTK